VKFVWKILELKGDDKAIPKWLADVELQIGQLRQHLAEL
jgi:hypothetical protein